MTENRFNIRRGMIAMAVGFCAFGLLTVFGIAKDGFDLPLSTAIILLPYLVAFEAMVFWLFARR